MKYSGDRSTESDEDDDEDEDGLDEEDTQLQMDHGVSGGVFVTVYACVEV